MRKILAILMCLAMLLALAACGGDDTPDPNAGVYEAVSATSGGLTLGIQTLFPNGFSLELKNGGKATFHYDGKDYSMKWQLAGESFHAEGGGADLNGTLSKGVMVLQNVLDSGIDITLVCEPLVQAAAQAEAQKPESGESGGGETPAEPTEPEPETFSVEDWWNGKWYGWAVIYTAGGAFSEDEDTAWDVCADVTLSGESGKIVVYAIGQTADNPTATVDLTWEQGSAEMGRMVSKSGNFLFDEVLEGEWVIDPGDSVVSSLDHMMCISGEYEEDSDGDWFTYYIFLRPWGMDWSDVEQANTEGMPYPDMMPLHYDDWYLSQIAEAGEQDPSVLVGSWTHSSGYTYVFRADGTGAYQKDGQEMTFTYEVEGSTLRILFAGSTLPMETTFTVEGNTLTIKDSFGSDVVYIKQ